MIDDFLAEAEGKMHKSVAAFSREIASIRTGRANPALVEKIMVRAYEQSLPLNQVAGISAPEARMLFVQPWDRGLLGAIEKALQTSELGLNPSNDGTVIRVPLPALTEERRREYVRLVRHKSEEAKVAVRNVRRDDADRIRHEERNGTAPEDEVRRALERLQKLTDITIEEIDRLASAKEAEVLEL